MRFLRERNRTGPDRPPCRPFFYTVVLKYLILWENRPWKSGYRRGTSPGRLNPLPADPRGHRFFLFFIP